VVEQTKVKVEEKPQCENFKKTGLKPLDSKYLFSYRGRLHKDFRGPSFRYDHKVFLIKAEGSPTPQKEIKRIAFFKEGSGLKVVYSTREIIEEFLVMKGEGFKPLDCEKCGGTTFKPSQKIANAVECGYCGKLYLKSRRE
jgi:hypothetical protein